MIYTRFGSPVTISRAELTDPAETSVRFVEIRYEQDGTIREGVAVGELRADGGIAEIAEAIDRARRTGGVA